MNYYYDVILNWNDDKIYDFYEWNDTDYLELIKKIPIYKVKHKTYLDIISNKVKVSSNFLEEIKDKTLISSKKLIKKIEYASLITDNKNVYALEFNTDGYVISRSKLLIDDEIGILEMTYSLKENDITYEIIEPLIIDNDLRQIKEALHLISLEVTNLYEQKDAAKLKYLYYEYQKEQIEDIDLIYKKILTDLTKPFNSELLKLYYIIKLSYHNV